MPYTPEQTEVILRRLMATAGVPAADVSSLVSALETRLTKMETDMTLSSVGDDWPITITAIRNNGTYSRSATAVAAFTDVTKTDTASPFTVIEAGFYSEITYGANGVDAVGSTQGVTSVIAVSNSGDANNEHAPYMGWLRYDATATPGRGWFADFSVHGAIATQQSLLTGINMFMNNYYNGSPSSAPSSGIHVISRPGSGGGADAAHAAATTYPMDVGIGISGKSGTPASPTGYGFTTGLRIGDTGGGWGASFGSLFADGINVSDWANIGIHVSGRSGGVGDAQPSFQATNTSASARAYQSFISGESAPRHTVGTNGDHFWSDGTTITVQLGFSAADVLAFGDGDGLQFGEAGSDLAAPAANRVRLFAKDNGSGKTQLVARFNSGAVQVIATEP